MSITLDGTNGITTPDVDTDGLTVDTNTLFVDAANNRVGIGTSSPTSRLDIRNTGGTSDKGLSIQTASAGNIGTIWTTLTDLNFGIAGAHVFTNFDGSTERMRIDSNGDVIMRSSSGGINQKVFKFGDLGILESGRSSTANSIHYRFNNPNGTVGSISTSASATNFNTSSDYRLKEDVQPMSGASDRVLALNPVNFAWKADGTRVDGFLAHEAQAIVPEAITGTKDEVDDEGNPVYQGIDQSKLVPLLTAALQDALQKIEALETRISALETPA